MVQSDSVFVNHKDHIKDIEQYVTINVPRAKARFYFFLGLVTALGVLTMKQDPSILPGHWFIAIFTLTSAGLGFLTAVNKFNQVKLVGLLLSTSLLIRAVSLLIRMVNDATLNTPGTWIAIIAWVGFWNSFTVNWLFLIEPYLTLHRKVFEIPVYKVKDLGHLMQDRTPLAESEPQQPQGETYHGNRSESPPRGP